MSSVHLCRWSFRQCNWQKVSTLWRMPSCLLRIDFYFPILEMCGLRRPLRAQPYGRSVASTGVAKPERTATMKHRLQNPYAITSVQSLLNSEGQPIGTWLLQSVTSILFRIFYDEKLFYRTILRFG